MQEESRADSYARMNDLSEPLRFDTSLLRGRRDFVLCVLQLGRIFRSIVAKSKHYWPPTKAHSYHLPQLTEERPSGVKICRSWTQVVKDYTDALVIRADGTETHDHWFGVKASDVLKRYNETWRHLPPNLFCLPVVEGAKLTFNKIGIHWVPASRERVAQCVDNVLECVAELHKRGWAHFDIRWPNVLFFPGKGDATLADAWVNGRWKVSEEKKGVKGVKGGGWEGDEQGQEDNDSE